MTESLKVVDRKPSKCKRPSKPENLREGSAMTDLKALRALCDAATDGEWRYFSSSQGCGAQIYLHDIAHCHGFYSHMDREQEKANARFIAATDPQTVRALIDEIEKLRGALETCRTIIKKHHDWHQKEIGEIMFPEAKDVVIDMSEEYAESALCGETCDALREIEQALKGTDNE